MSEQAAAGRASAQAASGGVLAKLLIFSVSLGVAPITSYFGSLKYVWNGNATYAAITAIVTANLVLVAYIITSVLEDKQAASLYSAPPKSLAETKKER